jgi:hypothetical protein
MRTLCFIISVSTSTARRSNPPYSKFSGKTSLLRDAALRSQLSSGAQDEYALNMRCAISKV